MNLQPRPREFFRTLLALLAALIVAGSNPSPLRASAPSQDSSAAIEIVRRLAIQQRGRLKPFDSFARESLQLITGSPSWNGEDPVVTVLKMAATPSDWLDAKLIEVPFVPLRERLGMDRRAKRISYNELVSTKALMRMMPAIIEKQQRDDKLTMLETETLEAFNRFVAFSGVIKQDFAMVPPSDPHGSQWEGILQGASAQSWTSWLAAWQEGGTEGLAQSATALAQALHTAGPSHYPAAWRISLEVFYNHHDPFVLARLLYGLAAVAFGAGLIWSAGRFRPLALALFVAAYAVHGSGIVTRVVLGGRPPVSNFFETMLWLPFVVASLALIFERIYRSGFFGAAASALAGFTLLLASHVPLDSSIAPVVAVLRSNLWLTIHVLTVVASYGALALAVGLAHLYAGCYLARGPGHGALPALGVAVYRATQVGVVLLAGGIMLGAVWANASWGRYWGWDPKETWALITLIWYLAMLHGRIAGWLRGVGVALATIAGFFLLLMTYYGVSFYLVGLHSYAGANAKPVPKLLLGYLGLELAFLGITALVAWRRRSQPEGAPASDVVVEGA